MSQGTTTTASGSSSLFFDPNSSTLYVDANLANSLQLEDGTSVELPTDVLLNSINSGQVQLVQNSQNGDYYDQLFAGSEQDPIALRAHVSSSSAKSRHESIKDLLHFQSSQGQQFWPSKSEEQQKKWTQINTPSRFSY